MIVGVQPTDPRRVDTQKLTTLSAEALSHAAGKMDTKQPTQKPNHGIQNLLSLQGNDLREQPLSARRKLLAKLPEKAPENVRLSATYATATKPRLRSAGFIRMSVMGSLPPRYESQTRYTRDLSKS